MSERTLVILFFGGYVLLATMFTLGVGYIEDNLEPSHTQEKCDD